MNDYISREAAQKVLCDACGNTACPRGLIPRCSFYEKMQSIPAADVRPVRWIPVTERLPGEDGDYLTLSESYVGGEPLTRVLSYSENLESVSKIFFEGVNRNGWYDYDGDVGFYEIETVTYWMPLPEPQKGGRT